MLSRSLPQISPHSDPESGVQLILILRTSLYQRNVTHHQAQGMGQPGTLQQAMRARDLGIGSILSGKGVPLRTTRYEAVLWVKRPPESPPALPHQQLSEDDNSRG